jgi:hypothetical protein
MANERTMELVRAVAPAAIANVGSAVTASKKFNVKSITMCNLLGTTQTVRLRYGAGNTFVLFDYDLSPKATVILSSLIAVLAAGEQFQAVTTTSGGVQLVITGIEEDA